MAHMPSSASVSCRGMSGRFSCLRVVSFWPDPKVFGAAAIPSGIGGTSDVLRPFTPGPFLTHNRPGLHSVRCEATVAWAPRNRVRLFTDQGEPSFLATPAPPQGPSLLPAWRGRLVGMVRGA